MTLSLSQSILLARVKELIRLVVEEMEQEFVGVNDVTAETSLLDLPIDSLGTLQLITRIGDAFNIRVPEGKEFEWEKIGDMLEYIQRAQAVESPGV